jgi:hypothetical protein
MVILAIFTMNIAHPGLLLGSAGTSAGREQMLMKEVPNSSENSLA